MQYTVKDWLQDTTMVKIWSNWKVAVLCVIAGITAILQSFFGASKTLFPNPTGLLIGLLLLVAPLFDYIKTKRSKTNSS